jgi:hypothetical protein
MYVSELEAANSLRFEEWDDGNIPCLRYFTGNQRTSLLVL